MKCAKCGYVFDEGMFCPECGTKYDEEEVKRIEAEQREAEKKRKEEEEIRKEALKKKAEEKKAQDEIRRQEEKEKRELELEKAKVEQEKLAVERAAHEAEIARQQNERARIEQENYVRMQEQERKHQEELTRTFNGVLYNTIDERNDAEFKYNEQVAIKKKTKKANSLAVWCFVLSIATYPLVMTMIWWLPSIILSIVFGVMALKEKTTKKGLTIAGLIVNGLFILICVLGMTLSIWINAEESGDESVEISSEESVAITDDVQEEKEEVGKELIIADESENQQDIQGIFPDSFNRSIGNPIIDANPDRYIPEGIINGFINPDDDAFYCDSTISGIVPGEYLIVGGGSTFIVISEEGKMTMQILGGNVAFENVYLESTESEAYLVRDNDDYFMVTFYEGGLYCRTSQPDDEDDWNEGFYEKSDDSDSENLFASGSDLQTEQQAVDEIKKENSIGEDWNNYESNQMSGLSYDERDFDSIQNFTFQNTKEAKKLIDFYEEILKANDSEFVNVEYERKGLLDGSKQYKQTLNSSNYKYYGEMKDGLPNGKGFVIEYISNYGVYLPKVLGNFKKGQLDGYAINFSVESLFRVISEGKYNKGKENGEYVIYSSKLLNYELGIDIDAEIIDQYQRYIREKKYATNSMETILIDVPLTPVYISGIGKLKDGEMTGNWISYYVNGNIKSEIKMNGNAGKGTLYNMDGTVQYEGEIKDGKYHGAGTLYKEDGSVEYKGKFKNGKIDN